MARMTLERLVEQLARAYGDGLCAVVLYGSAAAGEHIPRRSDTNVLVLVDALDLEGLRRESAIARAWAEDGNPPPLTLTVREWLGSADVFPMEYADILERHRVLHGNPPFDEVRVDREHLRLAVEQQALGKLLQLRQGVLATGADGRGLVELLAASLSTFMVILRGALRLHDERPPADYVALVGRGSDLAGFDAVPFLRVVEHVRGARKIASREAPGVLEGYLAGAGRLVEHVNRLS